MKLNQLSILEIIWQGPFTLADSQSTKHQSKFRKNGLYQIYGTHEVFGSGSLLYIGKTQEFAERLASHESWLADEYDEVQVYLGTVQNSKYKLQNIAEFNNPVSAAEKLLVYFTSPPYNSHYIEDYKDQQAEEGKHTLVMNFGRKRSLPPEVSTLWYHSPAWGKWDKKKKLLFNPSKISGFHQGKKHQKVN